MSALGRLACPAHACVNSACGLCSISKSICITFVWPNCTALEGWLGCPVVGHRSTPRSCVQMRMNVRPPSCGTSAEEAAPVSLRSARPAASACARTSGTTSAVRQM